MKEVAGKDGEHMDDATAAPVQYFEDFRPGMVSGTGGVTVTEAEIIRFARDFDPQPMHTDPQAARAITGGLIASGWHTAALTMRMLVGNPSYNPAPGTLGLGFDKLRWRLPVRPGDRLRVRMEVVEVRPSESRPDRGVITSRFTTLNQNDEVVQEMVSSALVPRRPA